MSKIQLIIALVMAAFSAFSYFGSSSVNPVTGEKQRVGGISPQQEVRMGLQAAREMAAQMGGLTQNPQARALVERVGQRLAQQSTAVKSGYPFRFHVLADPRTVNAFALPGGQIFITMALLSRLETEGQLAAVLGHEIGHVVARHSAERIAKAQFHQGLTGAFAIGTGSLEAAQISSMVSQMLMLKYSREDEYEADDLGLRVMTEAGYDPRAMIGVMRILERASGGGGRIPEWASTHPYIGNRIARIEQTLRERYPQGIPAGLTP
ncbi:MAG: M48 family metallopeptidase [Casimicrobiaceae bacterium]|nr:M48 family metallopeptidase [Casimicrobiaceae bacterium]MCX8099382.1 M48 family metallopeptidase [Casimicrobiaceae bacterium]MDW8311958.1 M48 family metallopeptidase [Burkholderiales bacterium]